MTPTVNDAQAVELGVRFRSSVAGTVTGLRYYKGPKNTGTHKGTLWTASGTSLATGTFTGETASGWQTMTFAAPITIAANTLYVASYYTTKGYYSANGNYFTKDYENAPLAAVASTGPGNGVYKYGASGFPTQTHQATNYWVDVIFSPSQLTPTPPPPAPPSPAECLVAVGPNADLNGALPFPADNPWNQDISGAAVDGNSAAILKRTGLTTNLHADFGSGFYNGVRIGIPYAVVPENQPLVPIKLGDYASESDPGPYPFPPNAPIEGYGTTDYADRHVLVLQRDCTKPSKLGKLYEAFRAYPQGNYPASVSSWNVSAGAVFDTNSNALRPHGWTSTDAAGLPVLPGLIRYEEIADGEIKHAIRFTLAAGYTRRAWVHPATHQAGYGTAADFSPFGMRVRLKSGVSDAGFPREVQIIMRAMKKYGLIMADNGGNWFISGAPDERWNNDNLRYLGYIHPSDFEVVKLGTIYTQ
ncbi:MAG: DUF4082 domain-containing protein [Geminicoccaceae bacterium]